MFVLLGACRCEVRQGDCGQVAPHGVADRVSLGLLPSSECGWAAAVAALKPSGGMLHVHGNVLDVEESDWATATVRSCHIKTLCYALLQARMAHACTLCRRICKAAAFVSHQVRAAHLHRC